VYIRKNINYIVPSHRREPKYLRGMRNRGETSQVQGVRGNYIIGTYRVYIRVSVRGSTAARLRMVGERNSGNSGSGKCMSEVRVLEFGKCGKCRKWDVPLHSPPLLRHGASTC